MDTDEFEILLKVVIIGESGVGKTKLLLRYTDGVFDEKSINTVGVDIKILMKKMYGHCLKIHLYDSAGQERFRSLIFKNIRNTDLAIVVYDICDRQSFTRLAYWVDSIQQNCESDTKILIIGNKIDLKSDRSVSDDEGRNFAELKGAYFYETSAKTNEKNCVSDAFDSIIEKTAKTLIDRHSENHEQEKDKIRRSTLILNRNIIQKKGCC